MSSLEAKLEEQKRIIDFLSSKYERDTGRRIQLPSSLGAVLGDESVVADDKNLEPRDEQKPETFAERVEGLRLPRGEPPKKGERTKQKLVISQYHMSLEKIDLSGFKNKRFSRAALKELIEGMQLLPCIRSLVLRNNGLNEDCERELLDILSLPKLKCLDLSSNCLPPKTAAAIGKKLKDEVAHVQWIDLTQNEFYQDFNANSLIVQGLKKQTQLVYAGLQVPMQLTEAMVKLLMPKRPPLALNLRNSQLSQPAFDYLCRAVSQPEFYLTGLSLKFCFLNFDCILGLSTALRFNKSLVKLDLSKNGLKSSVARYLLESLFDNVCLMQLDLSSNFLDDAFAKDLALVLENNPVLHTVDIANNQITHRGAQLILESLLKFNETLQSLGNLEDSMFMGVRLREELRQALLLNSLSADKKKQLFQQQQQTLKKNFVETKDGKVLEREGKEKDNLGYQLLKPVAFSNPVEDDYLALGVWNLT